MGPVRQGPHRSMPENRPMPRQMIDTESGKPKARARRIRRWVTFVVAVIVIAAIAYALGWIPHAGVHAQGPLPAQTEASGTGLVVERLYP
jgi:hypothetical protein